MRYYPLNRVKTNLKTSGGEFLLGNADYRGDYYETYDGNYYSGKDPIQGPSQKLEKKELPDLLRNETETPRSLNRTKVLNLTQNTEDYTRVAASPSATQSYLIPQPYYPLPTEEDYRRRSIIRYFAKKRNQAGFVIEIDKTTYDSLQKADSVYDYVTYDAVSCLWQIVGPLYDNRTAKKYKVAGIYDTNKRLVESKEETFRGLIAYINGDYTKFARITPI